MLLQAKMPKYMWGEAILTATYLTNRCPTTALEQKVTPAEIWYGSKPNLDKLKVFGCKAFALVPNQKRKKLESKSEKHVMVGYAPNGYRLWNTTKRSLIVGRDVRFDELSFPFGEVVGFNIHPS